MPQKWNAGTGKSKVVSSKTTQVAMAGSTPTLKPFKNNPEGNKNGNKRQAPTVSVTTSS
jgi:hypothetical protein